MDLMPLIYEMDVERPRDGVWDAWTTPEGVRSFLCARAVVDPVVGGRYVMWGDLDGEDAGSEPAMVLRVLSIDRPRLLQLGCEEAAGIAGERTAAVRRSQVRIILYPTLDGTRLELTHSGFQGSADSMWVRSRFDRFWWGALEGFRVAQGR
jgi:uncharacterized protein YndB with AHSA1/START domain